MATVKTTIWRISISLRECNLNEIHAMFSKYAFIKWLILLHGLGYFHNFTVGSGFMDYKKNLFTSFRVFLSINCLFCYELDYYFSEVICSLLSVYIKCRSSLYIGKACIKQKVFIKMNEKLIPLFHSTNKYRATNKMLDTGDVTINSFFPMISKSNATNYINYLRKQIKCRF